jgi:hypothetical protein
MLPAALILIPSTTGHRRISETSRHCEIFEGPEILPAGSVSTRVTRAVTDLARASCSGSVPSLGLALQACDEAASA